MGVIIVDGRAALRFRGAVSGYHRAVEEVASLKSKARGLEVELLDRGPLSATGIGLHFKGSVQDFEAVLKGLQEIRSRHAIDTVPLTDSPAIGTWPTPEIEGAAFGWSVFVRT